MSSTQGARSCVLLNGDCAYGRGKASGLATQEALRTWINFDPAPGSRGLWACSAIGVDAMDNAHSFHARDCMNDFSVIAVQIADCHMKVKDGVWLCYRALQRFHFGFSVKCVLVQAPGPSVPNPRQPLRPHAVK